MDNEIFVKIEDYNEVLEIVKVIKEKIDKADETVSKIEEVKAEEDKEIELWNKNLGNIKTKVHHIEKALSETKKG